MIIQEDKWNRYKWLVYYSVLVNILLAGFLIYTNIYFMNREDRCNMCSFKLEKTSFLQGVYFNDKYYCVWTKGTSKELINITVGHETCHDFVSKDYNHFCCDYGVKQQCK